jgi:chromosome segregation ATPase
LYGTTLRATAADATRAAADAAETARAETALRRRRDDEVESARRDLASARSKITLIERELDVERRERRRAMDDLSAERSRVETLSSALEHETTRYDSTRRELDDANDALATARDEARALTAELTDARAAIERLNEAARAAAATIASRDDALTRNAGAMKTLETTLKRTEHERFLLHDERDRLRKDLATERTNVTALREELEETREDAAAAAKTAASRGAALAASLADANATVTRVTSINEVLSQEIRTVATVVSTLASDVRSAEEIANGVLAADLADGVVVDPESATSSSTEELRSSVRAGVALMRKVSERLKSSSVEIDLLTHEKDGLHVRLGAETEARARSDAALFEEKVRNEKLTWEVEASTAASKEETKRRENLEKEIRTVSRKETAARAEVREREATIATLRERLEEMDAVKRDVAATLRCVLYTGPHTTAFAW